MAGSKLLGVLWVLAVIHEAIALSALSTNFAQAQLAHNPPAAAFVQRSNKFWAYDRVSKSWTETDISCLFNNGSWWHSCSGGRKTRVSSSSPSGQPLEFSSGHFAKGGTGASPQHTNSDGGSSAHDGKTSASSSSSSSGAAAEAEAEAPPPEELTSLMRISMVRFSDVSLWITGQSGSIYERFWNGVQWVVIPHDLPAFAGRATGVLSVNRTMVAMSESGILYQLQIDGNGQLLWVNCGPWLPANIQDSGVSSSNVSLTKSGLVSADDSAVYFATTDGSLTELQTLHPMKWLNHHHPRGGDIAAVADAGTLRSGVTFTISTSGDLYEYDYRARPAWKKHVRKGSAVEDLTLAPASGVAVHGLAGAASVSLFLLTKESFLVERRFHLNKWRWILHPVPDEDDPLSRSLGPLLLDAEHNPGRPMFSLFLTSENGVLWEYKIVKGNGRTTSESGVWLDHGHPFQTPIVKAVPGVSLSPGRIFFSLIDGRVGELHVPGLGGGNVGPVVGGSSGPSVRDRKQGGSYTWSILEAPETEGGNAEYCTSVRGPANCLEGIKDSQSGWQPPVSSTDISQRKRSGMKGRTGRRGGGVSATRAEAASVVKDSKSFVGSSSLLRAAPWNGSVSSQFMLRTMQAEKSIFFVGRDGAAFERFFSGEAWLWLKHEHSLSLSGIVGIYSGGVFVVDAEHNLFLRERIGNVLHWLNCTEKDGRKVVSGPPWDHGLLGEAHAATVEDALFLVDEAGNLMEFLVALRQFAWRDCGHPPNTEVAAILDQETLRYRVVFVVGADGKLYHFNRVTRLWISHFQPNNVLLSPITGTVVRPNIQSTRGSLFMRSEDGGLVEFHWDTFAGWKWTDHSFPDYKVTLSTSPGPNIGNKRLFVVGSDGKLYSRFWDETRWSWCDHGHPKPETVLQAERDIRSMVDPDHIGIERVADETEPNPVFSNLKFGVMDVYVSFNGECSLEVSPVRPIALSHSIVMVVLQDGRVASLKLDDGNWKWVSVHDTPTSSCQSSYWAATSPQS
ncbi:hypothetical protein MPTK1_2g18990 [Marchantia polymorpha subsp. ruderalis]|nr:hypothetical protein MARPO_0128s0014 [Marchantia polymorpha]BBN02887.1 hypothetical protein Mp_2g18990 [Marchantia polymorpha subsp. ruderalis]|eukprot:PTQ30190.1 hypothetical protein MARPO_0128s0014 [Marchantia polymorpha]